MERAIRVGAIGDWNPSLPSHVATNEAVSHAAVSLSVALESTWLPTEMLEQAGEAALAPFDALWCGPGSPYRSMAGALRAIRFAREEGRPFIAT